MSIWPVPLPDWFWAWAEWRLGRGAYKGHGADPKWRPGNVPDKIPYWAWARLAVLLGEKPPPPPPAPPKPPPTTDPALIEARKMLAYCRKFTGFYLYGGGHGVRAETIEPWMNLDCSSSTSGALYEFGLLGSEWVQVSGWFETWGLSGPGKYVTVHASDVHVWVAFDLPEGYFRFDTSPHGDGQRGPRVRASHRFESGFIHRHPAGL